MTHDEIQTKIMNRLNLTSDDAADRVSEEINQRYRELTASIGVSTSRRVETEILLDPTDSDTALPEVVVEGIEKVIRVRSTTETFTISSNSLASPTVITTPTAHELATGEFINIIDSNSTPVIDGRRRVTVVTPTTFTVPVNVTVAGTSGTYTLESSNKRVLDQLNYDELTTRVTGTGLPRYFAVKSMYSGYVTIVLDSFPPSDSFTISVEGYFITPELEGAVEPFIPGDFHDILVEGVLSDELRKMEKPDLAGIAEAKFTQRLSDLRMFIAKNSYEDIFQGRDARLPFWRRSWYSNYVWD